MNIKKVLKNYNVLSVEKGVNLVYVCVSLKDESERFDLPEKLNNYLFSFTIYKDYVTLYLKKGVLK